MGIYFILQIRAMKVPSVILEPLEGKPQVIWQLKRPSFLRHCTTFDKIHFTKTYIDYLSILDIERFLDDDIGLRLAFLFNQNTSNSESINELLNCYKIIISVIRTPKFAEDEDVWRDLCQNCEDEHWIIVEKTLKIFRGDNTQNAPLFTHLRKLKRVYLRKFDTREIFKSLFEDIRNNEHRITLWLGEIYKNIREVNQYDFEPKLKWENWEKIPIQSRKMKYIWFNRLKKQIFINFTFQFFKQQPIENIINFEVGARLLLSLSRFGTCGETELYKCLRACISIRDLINNPNRKTTPEEFFQEFRESNTKIWNECGDQLIQFKISENILTLDKYLYSIYDEEIKYIRTLPETIWILQSIWSRNKIAELCLQIMYIDMSNDLQF